jgi:hypothetical protein
LFTGAHTRPLSLIRALARYHEVVVVGRRRLAQT